MESRGLPPLAPPPCLPYLTLPQARTTYVSPWWPGPGPCPLLTGPPSRLFECSTAPPKYGAPVSYKPRGVLPPSVKMVDPAAVSVAPGDNSTAVDLDSVADPWVREQLLLSQLDLPFSYALFASNIMDAYYGGHVSEAYKQFPYSRLDSSRRSMETFTSKI